jgi:hypothetical protein
MNPEAIDIDKAGGWPGVPGLQFNRWNILVNPQSDRDRE